MDIHFIIILLIFIFVLISPDICLLIEKFETKNALEKTKTKQLNVNNQLLQICTNSPKNGTYRDGYCNIGEYDKGEQTVCAKMTKEFLDFIKEKGNDLSTPIKQNNFMGLKPGDKWCLSSLNWIKAHNHDKNIVPKIKLDATNIKTLYYIDKEILDENELIEY